MSDEQQLLARAEVLSDTSELGLMVVTILNGAAGAGVDVNAVTSLRAAIQALNESGAMVGYDVGLQAQYVAIAGTQKDRRPGGGYESDIEYLEAVRDAADAIRDHRLMVTKLAQEVANAHRAACDDLEEARLDLAAAHAMPTKKDCDGCHGRKRRAIAAAEAAIADAQRRIRLCVQAAEVLEPLFRRLQRAYLMMCRVPHDLGEVYELIYAFIARGGKMPYRGRWVEGASA